MSKPLSRKTYMQSGLLRNAFGLVWHSSDLPLLELQPLASPAVGLSSIQVCREASATWPALPPGPHDTPFLEMAPGDLRLQVEGIARFRIHGGAHIAYEPWDAGVSEQDIRTFLLGSAVGALLIQRGMLVLHGNALLKDGKAIVCLGHSGAGKSTTACALMQQGWQLLADDLVAITDEGQVLPGIPRIKLWHDAAEAFGFDPAALPPVSSGMQKYLLLGEAVQYSDQPAPLVALYLLDQQPHSGGEEEDRRINRITSQKDVALLLRNQAFRPLFVRGLRQEGANFVALARLQQHVPLAILPLPLGIPEMQAWLVQQDLLTAATSAEPPVALE